jgi:hypothetical protein
LPSGSADRSDHRRAGTDRANAGRATEEKQSTKRLATEGGGGYDTAQPATTAGLEVPVSCTGRTSIATLDVQGVLIPLHTASQAEDFHPSDRQLQILSSTLSYAPMEHVRRFGGALGYIRASGSGCTPNHGGGSDPAPWIRLSAASFADSLNQRLNITLLHEFGHVVDYMYGAMEGLRGRDPELYRLLANTPHTGRTQGPSEAFGDCYMIFVVTQIARQGYNHPAAPEAYRGEQATRRFTALINSPAFDNWNGVLKELRIDAPPIAGAVTAR